jgi:hypothetical protein
MRMEMLVRGMGDGDGMKGSSGPRYGGGGSVDNGLHGSVGAEPGLGTGDPAAGLQPGAEVGLGGLRADGDA